MATRKELVHRESKEMPECKNKHIKKIEHLSLTFICTNFTFNLWKLLIQLKQAKRIHRKIKKGLIFVNKSEKTLFLYYFATKFLRKKLIQDYLAEIRGKELLITIFSKIIKIKQCHYLQQERLTFYL